VSEGVSGKRITQTVDRHIQTYTQTRIPAPLMITGIRILVLLGSSGTDTGTGSRTSDADMQ
jgi:hypothetical protein